MLMRKELLSRHAEHPLQWKLYQSNRTDSNLILVPRVFVMLMPYNIVTSLATHLGSTGFVLLGAA